MGCQRRRMSHGDKHRSHSSGTAVAVEVAEGFSSPVSCSQACSKLKGIVEDVSVRGERACSGFK